MLKKPQSCCVPVKSSAEFEQVDMKISRKNALEPP